MLKITILILALITGCATTQPAPENILNSAGLTPYQPDSYETVESDGWTPNREVYDACIERFIKARSQYYSLIYQSDGFNIKAIVVLPAGFKADQKHPLVVFNRGGNRNFGYMTVCDLGLLRGFGETVPNAVLVMSQYRGSHGSDGHDEFGGHVVVWNPIYF